ncbi:adenylate/guanylate cyclase domain-containing protein [Vineibacter terrae]|uniref:adenylate/guanylate cyclase domain-containing protein n=1 Tax=Vineibacter terrae TaxID=2586908 RepID=UPI002E305070|nr:adenylate/guanylate cyclase domain-containing protein [Vineibacter terrae]HEX2891401.1 adenylate/guanylate cyclase domain-containing protein [Vineibacter terrae]
MSTAPTPAEIAGIRRRFYLMISSVFVVDAAMTTLYCLVADAWRVFPRNMISGALLLLVANFILARDLFAPIDRFLRGEGAFEDIQRRLTQLPIIAARNVALLILPLWIFRMYAPWFLPAESAAFPWPPLADGITTIVVVTLFFFTYTYFLASDYLAKLCVFLFRHFGRNLELYYGSYARKLGVALLVIAIAPLLAIIVDIYSYDSDKLRTEVLVDVADSLFAMAVAIFFVVRSLLRPVALLTRGMSKVAEGDLAVRVPVTSNDEIGQLTNTFNRMVEGLRDRERIRLTFGKYVSESVANALIQQTAGDSRIKAEARDATVLFTDIDGFTGIAERLPAEILVAAINEYLELVLEPIQRHGGVVNNFIGDGLLVSFNLPLANEDHAAAAVATALEIDKLVSGRTFAEGVAFGTRIGINTGLVIGGTVGAGDRLSYTLLGDPVNTAARLQELNKTHGTRILVSEATRQRCQDRFAFRNIGTVSVRGRAEPAVIYAVAPRPAVVAA